MTITKTLIIQTANAFSLDELKGKLQATIEKLAENEVIISASTGAGASYQLKERNKLTELVELYSSAVEYKENGTLNTASGSVPVFTPKFYI